MKFHGDDNLEIRTIKSFADILILKFLKTHSFSSGYEILRYLHDTFNVLFSPGTIYNAIYMLERKNLIKGDGDETGRIYSITDEGKKVLSSTAKSSVQIQELISNILSGN